MERIDIGGTALEAAAMGKGPSLLFLHGEDYFPQHLPWLERLAERFSVVAPRHPGFGGSPADAAIRKVDDLAYLYLDYLESRPGETVLVGASLGAWIALEMCVRQPACAARLVLLSPIGVKFGGREERDFMDVYAAADTDLVAAGFADPRRSRPDFPRMEPAAVEAEVRDRQTAASLVWNPYMHNPVLNRWLHRARLPTLVLRGEKDGIVAASNTEKLAKALPNARLQTIAGAGHYPQIEQAEATAGAIAAFAGR